MEKKTRKKREQQPEVKTILEIQANLVELKKLYVARKRLPKSLHRVLDDEIKKIKDEVQQKMKSL